MPKKILLFSDTTILEKTILCEDETELRFFFFIMGFYSSGLMNERFYDKMAIASKPDKQQPCGEAIYRK